MALNVVIPFLIPLEENIFNATRLFSGQESRKLAFETFRYCTLVFENAPVNTPIITVFARHIEGKTVRYSIVGGNQDGLFSVDSRTGRITVAAPLDHEVKSKHSLLVSSETSDGEKSETTVDLRVADVNDNIPKFQSNELKLTVIEEDQLVLPRDLSTVAARDYDWVDQNNLLYTLIGDGVDGYSADDAFFSINPQTGKITQLRPLNRDPPNGKSTWHLRVKVHDGQSDWVSTRTKKQDNIPRKWNSRLKRKLGTEDNYSKRFYKQKKSLAHSHSGALQPHQEKKHNSTFQIAFVETLSLKPPKNERENLMIKTISEFKNDKNLFLMPNLHPDNIHQQLNEPLNRNLKISASRIEQNPSFYNRNVSVYESIKLKSPASVKVLRPVVAYRNIPVKLQDFYSSNSSGAEATSTLEKESRHFSSRIRDKELKRVEKEIKKISDNRLIREVHRIDTKDNCDVLESLIRPLDSSQKARLKYLISQFKKSQNPQQEVHVVESIITIQVTDINDNAPVFPNTTIHVEVQENGPKDLFVAIVNAWDADDPGTASNAQLRYYLEKNAVDERNGAPIFRINPSTGEIRTSLCCLDRESTFEYQLQVVATDGGGLKGTGTVAVRLTDVNDNTPKFARREWKVVIDETAGTDKPDNSTLFEITVNDPDTSNQFLFRVVESSGWGWDFFGIRTSDSTGEVFAKRPLDFENKLQRNGFRFLVEVTDRGSWEDSRNVESAWVIVKLRDINDNPPIFQKKLIHVSISEDIYADSVVATIQAVDPDLNGTKPVSYKLADDWGNLKISTNGEIRTTTQLDREGPFGSRGLIRIIAVDQGIPQKSSTATVVISVSDVNDCPPRLIGVHGLHVQENADPSKVGTLFATDDDVWALGHGPPFTFALDQSNSISVFEKFDLKFIKELDSGRGGAELWTKEPLDREESRTISIKVLVRDAAKLASLSEVVVVIDDVNDNDMHPASKVIHVWKTKGTKTQTQIGKVFVDDPDDWDFEDKRYEWADQPHPLFSLDPQSGNIIASALIREGRYDLHFKVSDTVRDQGDVSANVTIQVQVLQPELLSHAVPLTFFNISSIDFTKNWSPDSNDGRLAELKALLLEIFYLEFASVKIVSVSDGPNSSTKIDDANRQKPSTIVWISVRNRLNSLMEASKLRGLLDIKKYEIENKMKLSITLDDILDYKILQSETKTGKTSQESPSSAFSLQPLLLPTSSNLTNHKPSSVEMDVDSLPLQVIDTNRTALVTPSLSRSFYCTKQTNKSQTSEGHFESNNYKFLLNTNSQSGCDFHSCLNGGKCVPTPNGNKCICPGSTWGNRCKILARSFKRDGYAWLDPLAPCFPLIISFKFLTHNKNGIILYSGPISERSPPVGSNKYGSKAQIFFKGLRAMNFPTPMLALQIHMNNLELYAIGNIGMARLELRSEGSSGFSDGKWHTIHIHIDEMGASLMSDYCTNGWRIPSVNSSHCFDHYRWKRNVPEKYPWKVPWQISLPLQIGGTAHALPKVNSHDWDSQLVDGSFEGCLSDLKINYELQDLGDMSFSENSAHGCSMQEKSCSDCLPWGYCSGGTTSEAFCSCHAGYFGSNCKKESTPVTFRNGEYAGVSLYFTPDPFRSTFRMRIKTLSRNATILYLNSTKDSSFLRLYIINGVICLDFKSKPIVKKEIKVSKPVTIAPYEEKIPESKIQLKIKEFSTKIKDTITPKEEDAIEPLSLSVCLTFLDVSDGTWHLLKGGRYGENLLLEVDEGDGLAKNDSLSLLKAKKEINIPKEFWVDPKNGIFVGGGQYKHSLFQDPITSGQQKICVDDVWLFGKSIPLSISSNYTSKWASITTPPTSNSGCDVINECEETECFTSGSCKTKNDFLNCGCPIGQMPTALGCKKYDPCFYAPCLHEGSCISTNGVANCSCSSAYVGDYCQWELGTNSTNNLTAPVLSVLVTAILILFAICGGLIWRYVRIRRRCRSSKSSSFNISKNLESTSNKQDHHSMRTCSSNDELPFHIESSFISNVENKLPESTAHVIRQTTSNIDLHNNKPEQLNSLSLIIDDSLSKANKENCGHYRDDLRAYAYEGDGLSSGSLGSAISGLRDEYKNSLEGIPVSLVLKDVVDLLKDLPDGCNSTLKKKSANCKSAVVNGAQYSSTPKISSDCKEYRQESIDTYYSLGKMEKTKL